MLHIQYIHKVLGLPGTFYEGYSYTIAYGRNSRFCSFVCDLCMLSGINSTVVNVTFSVCASFCNIETVLQLGELSVNKDAGSHNIYLAY